MVERTGRTTNHLCCSKRTWTKEDTRAATAFVKTRVTSHLALTRSRRRSRRSPFGQSRCSTALQTPAESVSKGTSRPAPLRCSQTACRRTTEEQAEQIPIPGHHCTMFMYHVPANAHDENRTFVDILHDCFVSIDYVYRRRRSHSCPPFVPSVNGLARALKTRIRILFRRRTFVTASGSIESISTGRAGSGSALNSPSRILVIQASTDKSRHRGIRSTFKRCIPPVVLRPDR